VLGLQRADDRVTVHREWFNQYNFHIVAGIDQLKKLVDICISRNLTSLDVESTGVDSRVYPDEFFEDGRITRHGIRTVDKIVGLCMSFDGKNGYYIPLAHEPEDSGNLPWDEAWDEITRLVFNCRIIFHNARYDAEMLYPVTGKEFWKHKEFEDTFFIAKVISPLKSFPAGLKPLTKTHLGIEMVELDELFTDEKKEQLKRYKERYNFGLLHPKEGKEYGCSDGIFTYQLYHALRPKIEGYEHIYDLEKAFSNVMRKMERNRVHLDIERVNQLFVDCTTAMRTTGDRIRELIESKTGRTGKWLSLNVGSPGQLSSCFFTDNEGLKLKPTPEMIQEEGGGFAVSYSDNSDDDDDDDSGGGEKITYSLKDEVLKSLHRHYGTKHLAKNNDEETEEKKPESIFELILEYRHYDKMNGSYIEKLTRSHDKYGDVRPSFNQIGTDTARLSSKAGKIEDGYSGINFQGIPRDSDDDKPELFKQIRTVIVPREGWLLLKIDYAGEELRVITNMSGDPLWTKSFLHEDGDVHSITARILFAKAEVSKDERNRGKRSNFAVIYGGGAGAISRNVGCSIEDGGRHMENMRTGLPGLMGYVEHQKKFAKKHKCVYTAFGRRMPIPTIDSPIRAIQKKAERCAINYTIQATSADILKFAMCYVDKQIRALGWEDRVRYVLTVHDEVVYEVRPEYLMEVTRKLDEWMVLPWRLPKNHGRQWVVPLETEPGIDIHWRARFDYFAMVDGRVVKKSEVDENGNFKGKLKKNQYFADGRVYQQIPDFLKGCIWKLPPEESDRIKAAQLVGAEWIQPPAPAIETTKKAPELPPTSSPETLVITAGSAAETPDPETIPHPESEQPFPPKSRPITHDSQQLESKTSEISDDAGFMEPEEADMEIDLSDIDISLDMGLTSDPKPTLCSVCKELQFETPSGMTCKNGHGGDDGIEVSSTTKKSSVPPPSPPPLSSPIVPSKQETRTARQINEEEVILRWTITAILSEEVSKKLRAICILAEGNTPLRVVGPSGAIILSEERGVRVDPQKFGFLASLFGIG
jgi:DNA polymerase I-like protein with 3'-5' exonuclease and polymerase domains